LQRRSRPGRAFTGILRTFSPVNIELFTQGEAGEAAYLDAFTNFRHHFRQVLRNGFGVVVELLR
jgi:hypothetical protein